MNWINNDTVLEGESIRLLPLKEDHFDELELMSKDERIWEFYPYDCTNSDRFRQLLHFALAEKEKGNHFPFVIYHKAKKKLIGSTRFLDIHAQHKKLEIGWTWLQPEYWTTHIN